jgi:hypothetical protein
LLVQSRARKICDRKTNFSVGSMKRYTQGMPIDYNRKFRFSNDNNIAAEKEMLLLQLSQDFLCSLETSEPMNK